MKYILVIDDLRTFTDTDEVRFTHARNSQDGHKLLESGWIYKGECIGKWDEIWLDWDLGIRPDKTFDDNRVIANYLGNYHEKFKDTIIKIVSSNPVGRAYIHLALDKYYEVQD